MIYAKRAYYPYASFISIHKNAAKVNIFPLLQEKIVTFTAKCLFFISVLCKLLIDFHFVFVLSNDGELPQETEIELMILFGLDLGTILLNS